MSIVKTYDVFCDEPGCLQWAEDCGRTSSGADARRAARRFGWTRNAGHDLCPDHSLPTQENDQ